MSEVDDRYKQYYLKADIKQAKLGIMLLIVPLVALLYNDYQFLGVSFEFYELITLRLAFLVFAILLYVYLDRFKNYRSYENAIALWGITGTIVNLLINASRPQNYLFHITLIVIIIFTACLIVPMRLVYKTLICLIAAIGQLLIIATGAQPSSAFEMVSLVFILVFALIIGLSSSQLIESLRIKSFKLQQDTINSEKRYRELADSLPEIVFETDDKGILTFVNKKGQEILGYTNSIQKQRSIFEFFTPEDKQKAITNVQERLQGQKSTGTEYKLITTDGTKLPVLAFSEQITKDGKQGLRGIVVNLTELKNAERKLAISNEKLRVSGSLTRHDIRNKLSIIISYAYLLKKKYPNNSDIIETLEKMEQAVRDSAKLFDFAKFYEQLGSEELGRINVEKAINDAIVLFPNIQGITILNECHDLTLIADSLLSQIFYNLIDNTLKHGKKATQIRIHYEKNRTTKLFYEDNGIGILDANKPKLFLETFSTGQGSGLGLKLIRRLVDFYGWNITEEGKPGKGVKIVISIPQTEEK
jgi:PAS domain S-box-containing protein